MLLGVYVLAGVLFYGVASLLAVSRVGVGDPNAGQTEHLDAITAVVLGGTSLFGGRGMILGTLVGAIVVGVLRNGLTLMGVNGRSPGADHRHPGDPGRHFRAVAMSLTCPHRASCRPAAGQALRQVTALDGADFELRAGEILAVIGDNGAGKIC